MAKAKKKTVAPSDKLNIIGIGIGGKGAVGDLVFKW